MFTSIAEETSNYAHQQIARIMGGRDQIQQIEHYRHRRHTRLGTWRHINEADIKIFIAHILIMLLYQLESLHFTTTGQQRLYTELPFLGDISVETNFRTFCGIFMWQTQKPIHLLVYQTTILLPRSVGL